MDKIVVKTNGKIPFVTSLLLSEGIKIFDIRPEGNGCVFGIGRKDREKCRRILIKNNKEFNVVSERTPSALKKKILSRSGLIAGTFFVAAALGFYSTTITAIDVSGNDRIPSEDIIAAVRKEMPVPSPKNSVDTEKIRDSVCLLPGVSSASVNTEGNTVFVTVLEELPPVPIDSGDVKSKFDASITKIVVYNGEGAIKVGDAVKRGDVLISPDENGVARGEVFGRIFLNEQIVVPKERIVVRRTGRVKKTYSLIGREIKYKGDFLLYEKSERNVWTPLVLPLKVKETTYYELEEMMEKADIEREKEGLIAEAFERLEARLPQNAQNVKKWFFIKTVDKMTVLDLYYEAEVKIND